jgi:hypothetical protein
VTLPSCDLRIPESDNLNAHLSCSMLSSPLSSVNAVL